MESKVCPNGYLALLQKLVINGIKVPGTIQCLMMLSDGTKAKEIEDQVKTLDIVEIVERSFVG